MKPSELPESNRDAIRRIGEFHRARNARVFGSLVRGEDREEIDLDDLVDPNPETTLFDIGAIRLEPRRLPGVEVDMVTPNALPEKFRAQVLAEAVPL